MGSVAGIIVEIPALATGIGVLGLVLGLLGFGAVTAKSKGHPLQDTRVAIATGGFLMMALFGIVYVILGTHP